MTTEKGKEKARRASRPRARAAKELQKVVRVEKDLQKTARVEKERVAMMMMTMTTTHQKVEKERVAVVTTTMETHAPEDNIVACDMPRVTSS